MKWILCVILLCAWASEGSANEEITVELPGGATMEMVWIEPGTFLMGTTEEQEQLMRDKGLWDDFSENEHPAHEVTLSQGFYLGKYEITQGQWESVMGTTPWSGHSYVQENPNHPAVYISWDDVQEFIQRLNEAAGEEVYRLPSEAEWEYACRSGTTTTWSFGDDESQLGDHAWYWDNAGDVGLEYAQAVGTKLPNLWGLHDMHGNVYEWCQDWYGPYTSDNQVDPTGPPGPDRFRVDRGAFFYDPARYTRSASRHGSSPSRRDFYLGSE